MLFASFVFSEEQQNDIAVFEREMLKYRAYSHSDQEQRQLRKIANEIRSSNLAPQVKVSLLLDLYENALYQLPDGELIITKGRLVSGLMMLIHKVFLELKGQEEFFSLRERYLNILVGVVSELEDHIIPNYKPPELQKESGINFSEDPKERRLRLEAAQAYTNKKMKESSLQVDIQNALTNFRPDHHFGRRMLRNLSSLFGNSAKEQELLKSYMSKIVQPTRAELKRMAAQSEQQKTLEVADNAALKHSSVGNTAMADMQKEQHSEQSQLAKYTQKEALPKAAEQLIEKGKLKSSRNWLNIALLVLLLISMLWAAWCIKSRKG